MIVLDTVGVRMRRRRRQLPRDSQQGQGGDQHERRQQRRAALGQGGDGDGDVRRGGSHQQQVAGAEPAAARGLQHRREAAHDQAREHGPRQVGVLQTGAAHHDQDRHDHAGQRQRGVLDGQTQGDCRPQPVVRLVADFLLGGVLLLHGGHPVTARPGGRQRLQGQPLHGDREDDHHVGHRQDQLPLRAGRQRQGKRHRDAAAQPRPGGHQPSGTPHEPHRTADGEEARSGHRDDRHGAGRKRCRVQVEHQQLQADQHEQHGVEHLVQQLPEGVQVLARLRGHAQPAPAVADEQPHDDHGQRARQVQQPRQGEAAGDQRQRDQHLDLVAVDAAQRQVAQPAQDQPQRRAAQGLLHEEQPQLAGVQLHGARRQPRQGREHHHREPVVEQRLAGDQGAQPGADAAAAQDGQHRHRVGGRHDRSEHQAPGEPQRQPQQPGARVRRQRHQRRGDDHAQRREQPHLQPAVQEVAQVDVQGAGEQQEAEHAAQQGLLQGGGRHQLARSLGDRQHARRPQDQHDDRDRQRDQHHPDGRRQADQPLVEKGKQSRDRQQ